MAIDKIQSPKSNINASNLNVGFDSLASTQKPSEITETDISSTSDMAQLINATKELVHHLRN